MNDQQLELLKQSLGQLAIGLATALAGMGITGLDFAGTYFSGGTSRSSGRNYDNRCWCSNRGGCSKSNGYDDYSNKVQRMGPRKGNTPGNNQVQNKQIDDIVKKYKLNKSQRRKLHDEITGQGYGYKEIEEIAEEIIRGK